MDELSNLAKQMREKQQAISRQELRVEEEESYLSDLRDDLARMITTNYCKLCLDK